MTARPVLAPVLLLTMGAASCGGFAPSAPPTASLPAGFQLYDGRELGFTIGLAPAWVEAGKAPDGVSFSDKRGAAILVHFEQAPSPDLKQAAGMLMFELTGGAGGPSRAVDVDGGLAGRPARRLASELDAGGVAQRLDVVVLLDGPRAWALALAGPSQQVEADRSDFEKMAQTFHFKSAQPAPPPRANVGIAAPGFHELDRIKGPVVINFFATWCVDCRSDMPVLARGAAAHRGSFSLVGVDCCGDSSAAVPGFLKQLGVDGQFRSVAYDGDHKLQQAYGVLGPPYTFFLDKQHVLRQVEVGPITPEKLEQALKNAGSV